MSVHVADEADGYLIHVAPDNAAYGAGNASYLKYTIPQMLFDRLRYCMYAYQKSTLIMPQVKHSTQLLFYGILLSMRERAPVPGFVNPDRVKRTTTLWAEYQRLASERVNTMRTNGLQHAHGLDINGRLEANRAARMKSVGLSPKEPQT